ncbi:MAG TPA: putative metal-binding motif-containing protein [Kofleriaceae bacterium]|nr:putative metal-binding motif-containing protein [Kofleriaceae bacterium]
MRTVLAFALVLGCGQSLVVKYRSPQGAVRYDRDGDGFAGPWECPNGSTACDAAALNAQPVAELDCDDGNASRHPGAADVPGDGIDSNCDGVDGVAQPPPPETKDLKLPGQETPAKTPLSND